MSEMTEMHFRSFFWAMTEVRSVAEMRSAAAFRPLPAAVLLVIAVSLTKMLAQLVREPAEFPGLLVGEAGGEIIHRSLPAVFDECCFRAAEIGKADVGEALVQIVFPADHETVLGKPADQFGDGRGADVEFFAQIAGREAVFRLDRHKRLLDGRGEMMLFPAGSALHGS